MSTPHCVNLMLYLNLASLAASAAADLLGEQALQPDMKELLAITI